MQSIFHKQQFIAWFNIFIPAFLNDPLDEINRTTLYYTPHVYNIRGSSKTTRFNDTTQVRSAQV